MGQYSKQLVVIPENCPQDHSCPAARICPVGALMQEANRAPTVAHDICIRCGRCISVCPKRALKFE